MDGMTILTAQTDSRAQLWSSATAVITQVLQVGHPVLSAVYTVNADCVATASMSGFVHLWDVNTGTCMCSFVGHGESPVRSVAFSQDGRAMITACEDGTSKIWDTWNGD